MFSLTCISRNIFLKITCCSFRFQNQTEAEIEKVFLGPQSRETYSFNTTEHSYILYLRKTPMYQENQKSHTKRTVSRRPAFRSKNDIQHMKRSYSYLVMSLLLCVLRIIFSELVLVKVPRSFSVISAKPSNVSFVLFNPFTSHCCICILSAW